MSGQPSAASPPTPCSGELLFSEMWRVMVDMLGVPATATLLRRSSKRASVTARSLEAVEIRRAGFGYTYVIPARWRDDRAALAGLRLLVGELRPLLVEMTGALVIDRLRATPTLERCGIFSPEVTDTEDGTQSRHQNQTPGEVNRDE